jgi:serine/threonine protein kinase
MATKHGAQATLPELSMGELSISAPLSNGREAQTAALSNGTYVNPRSICSSADYSKLTFHSKDGSGHDPLSAFQPPGHWSGKGQHVEFERKEFIPLIEGASIGRGASADVHMVTCQGITLARKQIYCNNRVKLEDLKRELEILKKLSHKHVVTLVGSYIQSKILGLLLFPAAACDLRVFLDEVDEQQRKSTKSDLIWESLSQLLGRLEIDKDLKSARKRLKEAYGCLTCGVQYLHQNHIRHKDIKPTNILLDRGSRLFITDFGISRDNSDASTSITDGNERGTPKYFAPEVSRFEPRGRSADIYSLGCVFLEMATVYYGESLASFEEFRTSDGDRSFHRSHEKLRSWMDLLRSEKVTGVEEPGTMMIGILDITEKMLAENQSRRPTISAVSQTLEFFSLFPLQDSYYGICCRPESYNERVEALERKSERQNAFLEGRIFAMQQKLVEQDEQRNQTALLKREHEREVGRLEGRIFAVQEEQQNMKKAHESKQSALLKNHELQIDQLKGDHDRERHQLRVMVDDMRQEQYEKSDQLEHHTEEIATLKDEYQSQTDQLKENIFVMQEKHQSEKIALSNKYEKHMALQDAHMNEMAKGASDYRYEREAIYNKYEAKIGKLEQELVFKDDDIRSLKVLNEEKMARITGLVSKVEDLRKDVANPDSPVDQPSKEEATRENTGKADVVEAAAPSDQNRTQAQNMALMEQNLPENANTITTEQQIAAWNQPIKGHQEKTNNSPLSSSGVSKETKEQKDRNTRENRQLTRGSSPKGSKPVRKFIWQKAAKKMS